jgi:hypothetical protein
MAQEQELGFDHRPGGLVSAELADGADGITGGMLDHRTIGSAVSSSRLISQARPPSPSRVDLPAGQIAVAHANL